MVAKQEYAMARWLKSALAVGCLSGGAADVDPRRILVCGDLREHGHQAWLHRRDVHMHL